MGSVNDLSLEGITSLCATITCLTDLCDLRIQ
jgi:hypothetical protein